MPQVPGFVSFHLMKGAVTPEHTLYASHTLWASEADFAARTIFEAFRSAHRGAGGHGEIYAGQPKLFSSVQTISA